MPPFPLLSVSDNGHHNSQDLLNDPDPGVITPLTLPPPPPNSLQSKYTGRALHITGTIHGENVRVFIYNFFCCFSVVLIHSNCLVNNKKKSMFLIDTLGICLPVPNAFEFCSQHAIQPGFLHAFSGYF